MKQCYIIHHFFPSCSVAVIVFIIVIKRINKKNKRKALAEAEEKDAMM